MTFGTVANLRALIPCLPLGIPLTFSLMSLQIMDAALSHLAVVLRVFQPDGSSPRSDDGTKDQSRHIPSKQTIADLKGHLEYVTRELLQAHVSFLKHKSCPDADAAVTAATEHVTRLKAVYRDLLRADGSQAVIRILESLLDGRPS